jgi:adenosylcobalamin-dependent ribonucleoside-triphosphate reductase
MNIPWGPVGEAVYNRTYSRETSPGRFETWVETVDRVVTGNLEFVYGGEETWSNETWREYRDLKRLMRRFAIIPAGRQLNATGVEGRQYLFNCHVAGWGNDFSEHFKFTFMRLVEGGGVGSNYSTKYIAPYGPPTRRVARLSFVCDESHKDIEKLRGHLFERPTGWLWRVRDTREGWADALAYLIDRSMEGCSDSPVEIVFDVSDVRAEGSPLVSSGGVAAGPLPLVVMLETVANVLNQAYAQGHFTPVDVMEIDHAIAIGAVAGGKRRSARMSIVRWDDPFIMEFIHAKKDGTAHWSTNISVEIDDAFVNAIRKPGNVKHNAQDYAAKAVHEAVCEAVLTNGEPGYWNSELSQVGEVGTIIATNPCGEIPLESWESCNLGHVNLEAFIDYENSAGFDWQGLVEAHRLMTRFLIRSTFGDINDPKQREIQAKNRRIGVGHFGVQGFFAKLGVKYSDIPYRTGPLNPRGLIRMLKSHVREAARDYCFELRIPECVKVTTEAPTGSVAKLPGATEGIHPILYKWYEQRIRFSKRDEREFGQVLDYMSQGFAVEDDIYDPSGMTAVVVLPTENILIAEVRELVKTYDLDFDESVVESAEDLTLAQMLEVQAFFQEVWADNSVSYTCNIPEGRYTPEALQEILAVYLPRLKGTTIMVDATRKQAPYTRISREEYAQVTAKRIEDSADFECSTGACGI